MERYLYKNLLEWKDNPRKKPLVLFGARQVGKTWLLKEFAAKEYAKSVFVSFDRDEAARELVRSETSAANVLRGLSAIKGVDITPGDTLVVLDEIQDASEALERLKAISEDAGDVHVAACGSLLGTALHRNVSYPVGKVDELYLHPMTFGEFLMANGCGGMERLAREGDWSLINATGVKFADQLRQYYYTGGMPAAVRAYVEGSGLTEVRRIQKQILSDYERDFSKHAPARVVPRIRMVWQNIVGQLAKENKKFLFGAMKKGARAAEFEEAIQWLADAGLVRKVCRVSAVQMPLKFYEERNAFKLFLPDVGLMGAMADVPAGLMLVGNSVFREFKGAFTEVYAHSQMAAAGLPVYYHSPERSRIELDFAVQLSDNVYPVEVKAEENLKSKSMKAFIAAHPGLKGIRLSMRGHEDQGWVENLPLYAFADSLKRRASGLS